MPKIDAVSDTNSDKESTSSTNSSTHNSPLKTRAALNQKSKLTDTISSKLKKASISNKHDSSHEHSRRSSFSSNATSHTTPRSKSADHKFNNGTSYKDYELLETVRFICQGRSNDQFYREKTRFFKDLDITNYKNVCDHVAVFNRFIANYKKINHGTQDYLNKMPKATEDCARYWECWSQEVRKSENFQFPDFGTLAITLPSMSSTKFMTKSSKTLEISINTKLFRSKLMGKYDQT